MRSVVHIGMSKISYANLYAVCPIPASYAEPVDQFTLHGIAQAGTGRSANRTVGADVDFGFDNVFAPIATTGGNVSGESESRQRGHSDVMSAADSRFQHAAAPHRDAAVEADIVYSSSPGVSADTSEFNIDNFTGS